MQIAHDKKNWSGAVSDFRTLKQTFCLPFEQLIPYVCSEVQRRMRVLARNTPLRETSFPESQVRELIQQFWKEQTDEEADNPFATKRNFTLHALLPSIDSLEIVKFMLRIEEIIEIEIPPKFIKRGGYHSSDEMIQHLMPQIRKLYSTKGA